MWKKPGLPGLGKAYTASHLDSLDSLVLSEMILNTELPVSLLALPLSWMHNE